MRIYIALAALKCLILANTDANAISMRIEESLKSELGNRIYYADDFI